MYYNTLFVGMDVHKETFSLCCYDLQQDRIFHAQKMEADYNQVLNYLNAVRKAIGDDVQFVCGNPCFCSFVDTYIIQVNPRCYKSEVITYCLTSRLRLQG